MTAWHITNAVLVQPGQGVVRGSVLLEGGKIGAINPIQHGPLKDCVRLDAEGALLTPGLVDIHTHGIHEYCYERDPQDLFDGTSQLAGYGTTCVLPTLYSVLKPDSLAQLEYLSCALAEIDRVAVPGFHMEGPFLAIPGAGASTIPGDLTLLGELLAAAAGRVRAMSVSPDCPNVIPVIEHLCDQNVTVFLTHTRATAEATQAAIAAGARHATHFYNVFPPPAEVEPGVRGVGAVEAVLADPRCTVDFICDGVHVDPLAVQLALLVKGWQGLVAITDSNVGAGMADGVHATPWGYSVRVSQANAVRVYDPSHPLHGQLAGSSLTMNQAVANLHRWLDIPSHEIWAMGTRNPAARVGLTTKGVLEVGADADLVLWNHVGDQFEPQRTWIGGECVYARDGNSESKSRGHGEYVSL